MHLTPLTERFVFHFGEMGSRWGVNRTVGQIYALLYIAGRPMNADEIGETLQFSRSNVGMGLKELQSWRLVRLSHVAGDRRDYFQAPDDVWEIFRTLVEEHRKREIEPTLSLLRDALMVKPETPDDQAAQGRMRSMYELIEMTTGLLDEVQKLSPEKLQHLMRLGNRFQKVVEFAEKLRPGGKEKDRQ